MPEHRQLQNYLFYFLRLDLLDYRIGEETVELEFKESMTGRAERGLVIPGQMHLLTPDRKQAGRTEKRAGGMSSA